MSSRTPSYHNRVKRVFAALCEAWLRLNSGNNTQPLSEMEIVAGLYAQGDAGLCAYLRPAGCGLSSTAMPHLRLASEIEFPEELLDTQLRDEWTTLKALGDSVRQNLKLRPITAPDDVDAETERPPFLSPTAPFHAASAHSLTAFAPSPPTTRGPPPYSRSRGSEVRPPSCSHSNAHPYSRNLRRPSRLLLKVYLPVYTRS